MISGKGGNSLLFFFFFCSISGGFIDERQTSSARTRPSWARALEFSHLDAEIGVKDIVTTFAEVYDFHLNLKDLNVFLSNVVLQVHAAGKETLEDVFGRLNKEVDEIMARRRDTEKEQALIITGIDVEKLRDVTDKYAGHVETNQVLKIIDESIEKLIIFGVLSPSGVPELHHELAKLELKIRSKLHNNDGINRTAVSAFFDSLMKTVEDSVTKKRALIEQKDDLPKQFRSEIAYLFYKLAWDSIFNESAAKEIFAKIKPIILAFCYTNHWGWHNEELNLLEEFAQALEESKPEEGDSFAEETHRYRRSWVGIFQNKFPNCKHVYQNYLDEDGIKLKKEKERERKKQRQEMSQQKNSELKI